MKGLATLLDAFAVLAAERPRARLILAGPGDPGDVEAWRRYAEEAGVADRVTLTGFVDELAYERLLAEASLGVQLRTVTNGEASGTICDCLGAALATVATDVGWVAELPHDVVVRVAHDVTPGVLAAELAGLLDAPERRVRLEQAARAYAESNTFAAVAARYVEALEVEPVPR